MRRRRLEWGRVYEHTLKNGANKCSDYYRKGLQMLHFELFYLFQTLFFCFSICFIVEK